MHEICLGLTRTAFNERVATPEGLAGLLRDEAAHDVALARISNGGLPGDMRLFQHRKTRLNYLGGSLCLDDYRKHSGAPLGLEHESY